MDISTLFLLIATSGIVAIAYIGYLTWRILKEDEGTKEIKEISGYIREGSNAYMKRQYSLIAAIIAVIAIIIAVFVGPLVGIAYGIGGLCSSLTGFTGIFIAVRSNSRTANAARTKGLGKALDVAFKGGSVLAFSVVGIGVLGITSLFLLFGGYDMSKAVDVANTIIGFSFGASTVALFARVGGGIYTKAADVGTDLVGKVEKGIPEDDPRNPGVIADNVGDNVGDVAGMGADLFESYVGAIVSSMILGAILYQLPGGISKVEWVLLPLIVSAVGIFASIITGFTIRGDPATALTRATIISTVITAVISYFVMTNLLGSAWFEPFVSILCGLIVGVIIGETSDYFTSNRYSPTKRVAIADQGGPALGILTGFSLGMYSVFIPIVFIAVGELIAYSVGGLYGVAISAVGMLSISGTVVAADAYGPITDNAAGIAEQAKLPGEVRDICDKLDSVGNTMKSVCKGFAIGSAALTAIAFLVTMTQIPAFTQYISEVGSLDRILSILNPKLFAGLLIGSAFPAFFTGVVVLAVSNGANKLVDEIRRQFREIKGIMEGTAKPDYAQCVTIITTNAIKSLVLPGIIAIIAPLIIGFLIGPDALLGMSAGAIITGLLLGLFQGNVGNTWDNAKKYVEAGNLGGKGSPTHAAAVIGDTVGDPFKDSSGPGLNIFIKLMTITALVFMPLIIQYFI
ncbi:MAG: K(+)-stimulated pyrophosphate-energized sodium pump [Thermoproteota archaeon]|nr:K(+)-stimulated pyrophosphate-energized sodium pump [Thermoproteota archaeon]